MLADSSQLIIYRKIRNAVPFVGFLKVIEHYKIEGMDQEVLINTLYDSVNQLVELSQNQSFSGNLWHTYLTYLIANDENSFSRFCEKKGKVDGTINELVLSDLKIIKSLFEFDWSELENRLGIKAMSMLENYEPANMQGIVFNKRVRDRINELSVKLAKSKDEYELLEHISEFYNDYGVGKFGLHKSFRIVHQGEQVNIEPITNVEHKKLDDLVGYELQKKQLVENTLAFIKGEKANNVLLFGDSGTGKSTSVKAILNEYFPQGLRMIEVYKHQFQDLSYVISQIKNRNYKFIIYMDDLSFEESELEYKYLKAIIEGGLEKKPDNVLIYATSNRRHLVKETWNDKKQAPDDVHGNDAKQEKLSLYARFGVTIMFGSPSQKEFLEIVDTLAEKRGIVMDKELLHQQAIRWELTHGGFSGRAAEQVITQVLALQNLKENEEKLS